jgi:hypothetical protein
LHPDAFVIQASEGTQPLRANARTFQNLSFPVRLRNLGKINVGGGVVPIFASQRTSVISEINANPAHTAHFGL